MTAGARSSLLVIGLLIAGAAYAAWASGARPFTDAAYLAVSVPSALFVAMLAPPLARAIGGRGREAGAANAGGAGAASAARAGSAAAWLAVIALLVAVELASYFHGGTRSAYPTISSGVDSLFRNRGARAAGWTVWLAVGWFLVRR